MGILSQCTQSHILSTEGGLLGLRSKAAQSDWYFGPTALMFGCRAEGPSTYDICETSLWNDFRAPNSGQNMVFASQIPRKDHYGGEDTIHFSNIRPQELPKGFRV